jgi:predicted DsbA family dithiol-disulfide isomerase
MSPGHEEPPSPPGAKKTPIDIVIVSDVICPWCLVGTRRLQQVLAAMDHVEARVEYKPYLLDPDVPPEGSDLRERLQRKYGRDPEVIFRHVTTAARDVGVALDFTRITRTPNTIAAHTLIRHAAARGTQAALAEALYVAYFLDGQDVGDQEVLTRIAAAHGFEPEDVRRLLADPAERAATISEAAQLARAGVSGVPFFVFGGKVAFSGAQPAHVFRDAIAQATAT